MPQNLFHGGADGAQSEWDSPVRRDTFIDPHRHPNRADSHEEDKEAKNRLQAKANITNEPINGANAGTVEKMIMTKEEMRAISRP